MRKVMYRVFPVIASVSLVLCLLIFPVSANTVHKVLNYKDYVYATSDDDLGNTVEYYQLPVNDCAAQVIDMNGNRYLSPGTFSGTLYGDVSLDRHIAVGAYWPGQGINKTYLIASNIPDGTKVTVDCKFSLSDDTQEILMQLVYKFGVSYLDENFNVIGAQATSVRVVDYVGNGYSDYIYDGLLYEPLTLNKPSHAAYLCFYATFDMYVAQSHEDSFYVDWWIDQPYFESTYRAPLPSVPGGVTLNNDMVDWLKDVVDGFLDFEVAPGFSMNKIVYVILVVGILLWLIKLIS